MNHWIPVSNGDPRALGIYLRHYSARKNGPTQQRHANSNRFMPPGESLVLLTRTCDSLFCWSRERYRRDGQKGVNCNVFRNEGGELSSDLIRGAVDWASWRWPDERLFTFVDSQRIQSTNPGYCFQMAGWTPCGRTKGGLAILELLPMVAPSQRLTHLPVPVERSKSRGLQ